MIIYLGLGLEESALPYPTSSTAGQLYVGPRQLLALLETHLGLVYPPDNIEHLRNEQYRQLLRQFLAEDENVFFARSFLADELGTAAELLLRRDELRSAGWNFVADTTTPSRLRCFAALEQLLDDPASEHTLSPGLADRLCEVIDALPDRHHPITTIYLHEPVDLLPPGLHRLLTALGEQGVIISPLPAPTGAPPDTDLGQFQQIVRAGKPLQTLHLRGDGSLVLLRAHRETHIAAWLAALLRHNDNWCPSCLLTVKNRTLDTALLQEGLPGLGVPSASLARPTLQILKLAPAFLWEPIDPQKIMEFVSLAVKPLHPELANRIGAFLSQTPGLYSDRWYGMIRRFLDEDLPKLAQWNRQVVPEEIRRQYEFWFLPRRYPVQDTAPRQRVRELFAYLQRWARQQFEDDASEQTSLLVLSDQARRITELLDALPNDELTFLEVERVVRTIYEPAPVQPEVAEAGCMSVAHHPAAVYGPVGDLVWWDFIAGDPDYFFSRWYPPESAYLTERGVALLSPEQQNQRLVWQRQRPVLHTSQRLILCLPELVDGQVVQPHPLLGDLQAAFGDLTGITVSIDQAANAAPVMEGFKLPDFGALEFQPLARPVPFLRVQRSEQLAARKSETPSSLEDLFYYPYKWVLRHKIELRNSSILSLVSDASLLGNLAHSFIERMVQDADLAWEKAAIEHWIDEQAEDILRKEGAPLLLYGREPERAAFIKRMKYASWSLLHFLRVNGWTVEAAEAPLEGHLHEVPINGRADLVLRRQDESAVIDLKWRGGSRYRDRVRNGEDLQLVLYASFMAADADQDWAHTAYFILENGTLIARNEQGFKGAETVGADVDHQQSYRDIYQRMTDTYEWRRQQLTEGRVEIRCQHTLDNLEDEYGAQLLDLLEMRQEDAYFDDYRTLIGLVE